jgi:hypothetical protein
MSSWLYQFWLFGFKTAKHWGNGPRYWNANLLGFESCEDPGPQTSSIREAEISRNVASMERWAGTTEGPQEQLHPSSLCRWSIHYKCTIRYMETPEPESTVEQVVEPSDISNWHDWPAKWREPPFHERLTAGLQSNDFSNITTSRLPVGVPLIAKATANAPDVLLQEALGFAIMGRNPELVEELSYQLDCDAVELKDFYPLHMAVSFLDGATSCCNTFNAVIKCPFGLKSVRDRRILYVNNLGHTVLDSLMIAILKSHSSTGVGVIDEALEHQRRFLGEEIDICGRWDADSDCFRALLHQGEASIPTVWKHKFCHTSIQTICHCITLLHQSDVFEPLLSTSSGIFLKHCSECGLKMQLQPLHTLVLTTFHLASSGCDGEDLFGMLACLLTVVSGEINPLGTAEVSAELLFCGSPMTVSCSHEPLTAAELADRVPSSCIQGWSPMVRTGWEIFRMVLWIVQTASQMTKERDSQDKDTEYEEYEYDTDGYCDSHEMRTAITHNPVLATLYAAVQTELLTYRRLRELDHWISENFDLVRLLRDLQEGDDSLPSIGFVRKELLRPFCSCGVFISRPQLVASASDACMHYFSNMDDWGRTTFIPFPWGDL